MRRRDFISLLGSGAMTWPLAVRAQPTPIALVGLLSGFQLDDRLFGAIRQGLKEAGYIEGHNVAIKYRSADGRFDRLPALAAELVADPVSIIIALAPLAATAAKSLTSTIPIVFALGPDPVELGLVSSLNHPGGNITGVTFFINSLGAKRLEFLHQAVPHAALIGFITNPRNPTTKSQIVDIQTAARALNVRLLFLDAGNETDIGSAFASAVQQHANAMIIGADSFFLSRRDQLVGLAARYELPAVYYLREFAIGGGLISYGASITDAYRLAGGYAGRILSGEAPGQLPIQQTVKFELVINLKTAKSLGLALPPSLIATADEVVD